VSGNGPAQDDKRTVYYARDIHQLNLVLGKFLQKSRSETVLLVHEAGHLVARQGASSFASEDTVTALVAGTCAASRAMAEMLGSEEFSSMIPCGGGHRILLLRVGENAVMAVAFADDTSVQVVRTYALDAIRRLEAIFRAALESEGDGSEEIQGPSFDREIGGALKNLFG
jgi:predicted regulator of Ras-like GTPase activity (Roadblock/LC7/MglB family)